MGEYNATIHSALRHEVFVRQTVKAVALHALASIPAGNWQQLGHMRHGAVKRSVETGDLRYLRKFRRESFHQRDFGGKMFRVEPADAS